MTSVPRGSFSTITVGAPIIAEGTTNASSGTSATLTICTGPCCRTARCASSLPMYGSPPPPVPRIAAPTAMSSISASPTSRNAHPPEIEIADGLHADARGVARQIRDRHILDVDHPDRAAVGACGDRALDCLCLRLLDRLRPRRPLERDDLVDLATDLRDRGADRARDGEMLV